MTMLQIMNSLTKTTMKMNNKNNNSAINAGPKGTLSKDLSIQVSEWMHTPTLSLFKEEDTIRKAYNDRLDKLGLDPITAQGSNDELLINLQLLLEDIGLAHAEQDAFEEYFDWEAWCKHHEDWEEQYQEIATELDFEEEQIEHIAECTPPIDVYVTIVEKERQYGIFYFSGLTW